MNSQENRETGGLTARRAAEVVEGQLAHALPPGLYLVATPIGNLAEGAGAAPLAALMQERERMQGKRVGLILSGGNVDREVFAEVLAGRTPRS